MLPVLLNILGPFRLDHAYAVSEAFYSTGGRLHHQSGDFQRAVFYVTQKGRIHTSLVTVSYALTPILLNEGGFCCIPGSHKSEFPTPEEFFLPSDNPLVRQIPQDAGDAIIFSEAVTHGTYQSRSGLIRRSILIRYCPGYVQFRKPYDGYDPSRLPPTRQFFDATEGSLDCPNLTERQKAILLMPPFAVDEKARNRQIPTD